MCTQRKIGLLARIGALEVSVEGDDPEGTAQVLLLALEGPVCAAIEAGALGLSVYWRVGPGGSPDEAAEAATLVRAFVAGLCAMAGAVEVIAA